MMRTHGTVGVLRSLCVAFLLASSATGAPAQDPAPGAPVTAADINALRAQAEARDPNGCSSVFRWTDDPIVPGQTPVRAHHLIELRRAINEMVQGQCPTIHEQVTLQGVRLENGTSGYRYVQGSVQNTGSTQITGYQLFVRVRFFGGNDQPIAEVVDHLRADDNFSRKTTLAPQEQRLFSVQVQDADIDGWEYFQVVSFEAEQKSVLCSGCAGRHVRQREQVTVQGVWFADDVSGNRYVHGAVQNSGSTPLVGYYLHVRVVFFDAADEIVAEQVNYLRTDDNFSRKTSLAPGEQRLFFVQVSDSSIEGWSYFRVVSFEDDGRSIPCGGCEERHSRQLEQVTFENVRFQDAPGVNSLVSGTVRNSGLTRLVGYYLTVRVRFFSGNVLTAESTNYLRTDDNFSRKTALSPQESRLFAVGIADSALARGWTSFQVSLDNDGTTMDCTNCDQRYTQ